MKDPKPGAICKSVTPGQVKNERPKVPKTCKECGKTFTRVARLRIHERTHVRFKITARLENGPLYANTQIVTKHLWREGV